MRKLIKKKKKCKGKPNYQYHSQSESDSSIVVAANTMMVESAINHNSDFDDLLIRLINWNFLRKEVEWTPILYNICQV